jgi:hypothetical protein
MCLGSINAPIHVICIKQKITTRSSTEAELVALAESVEDVLWARGLLNELSLEQKAPTRIEQDNKSAMIMANRGPGRVGKSKAIDVRHFWITEHIENKEIHLVHVPSMQMIADGLTKPLSRQLFLQWRNWILNHMPSQ